MKRAVVWMLLCMLLLSAVPVRGEEIVELVIETVTFGAENPGIPAVEEAVNQITVPTIGVRVRLLDVSIQQHAQRVSMMIENNEPLDLVMAGLTLPMVSMAADEMLLPLDELVEEFGPDIRALFGDQLSAGRVGDRLYAIPGDAYCARSGGIVYNQTIAKAAGVTVPDPCTLEDLDRVFAAVKAYDPDLYGMAFETGDVSIMNYFFELENCGSGIFAFGVTFDPQGSTELENLFSSKQYRDFCHKTREWLEKEYLPTDAMTGGILPGTRMASGQIFCQPTSFAPIEGPTSRSVSSQQTWVLVQTTHALSSTSAIQERMWAVPVTSAHPDKAVQFLNLLYSDERLANLLSNGIENVHFTRVSPHVIQSTKAGDYRRVFTRFGDQAKVDHWLPSTEDFAAEMIAFENEALVSRTLGYTFDSAAVAREVEAVNAVIASYTPALECGLVTDVDGALMIFNQELKKAGIDQIIAENQRQLTAWLAEREMESENMNP